MEHCHQRKVPMPCAGRETRAGRSLRWKMRHRSYLDKTSNPNFFNHLRLGRYSWWSIAIREKSQLFHTLIFRASWHGGKKFEPNCRRDGGLVEIFTSSKDFEEYVGQREDSVSLEVIQSNHKPRSRSFLNINFHDLRRNPPASSSCQFCILRHREQPGSGSRS